MRLFFSSIGCIALMLVTINALQLRSKEVMLIPRKVLFDNPVRTQPKISPDGKKVAYLAPSKDNVLNIWVQELSADDNATWNNQTLNKATQITHDAHRGIRQYFWAPDSQHIVYLQDKDGDENWHLYGVDSASQEVRCYTPFDNVQARIHSIDKRFPDTILVYLNKDNPAFHNLYKLNLSSGGLTCIAHNGPALSALIFYTDMSWQVKGAFCSTSTGGRCFAVKDDHGAWRTLFTWDVDDAEIVEPLGFDASGEHIYISDVRNSNTARCVKYNILKQTKQILAEDKQYDMMSALFDADTRDILAVTFTKERQEWVALDPAFEKTLNAMLSIDQGELHIINCDDAKNIYSIVFEKDNGPAAYYVYNCAAQKGMFLFENKPDLKQYTLASMHPIKVTARDGLLLHGYLTLPVGKNHKLPLVLNVHGGPHVRDTWGYDPEAQWLANRGYAVLQINYRGSSGYGKAFLNAGNKEWGGKMHDDLIDSVQWAIKEGIADPQKIAIYGGSYGGYAALVGAAFTPDIFCCAVDIVGVSNLLTLLQSIPPYWEVFKSSFYKRVGDPTTEQEFLKSRSPLFKASQIKIPLLIAHGANDPRVKQAESEQIVAVLKENNIPYEYLLFPDEGHGFARPENKFKFYAAAERFLATHVGGKCEQ